MTSITEPVSQSIDWDYNDAFSRNLGLISEKEQQTLRNSRVAIAGMGGVGGIHLLTLARLGIGHFTIADPDEFEVANFNRQAGATTNAIGRNKAEELADRARAINPEVQIDVFPEAIGPTNVDQFLSGADALIDGIDFFEIGARRLIFKEARQRGIWLVIAGPIGFSTAWLTFDPNGLEFERYFDFNDNQSHLEQVIAFAVGLTPKATHIPYIDLNHVSLQDRVGPSAGLACQLCAGVAASETLKILLRRGKLRPAPYFHQFDAYRQKLRRGHLLWGNRNPIQRFKRHILRRKFG